MRRLAFNALLRLTTLLVILNQETASTSPWRLNDEQREVLTALCEHQRVIVLKGRQVGVSTVCCLFDLAFAVAHPGVNVAIVADTEEKSIGLLAKIRAWAEQLGIPVDKANDKATSFTLGNGSTIDALSAVSTADEGESRVGRSKTYLLLHMSELAFWRNDRAVFRALTSGATSPHVRMVIESTASAADNLFKSMWSDDDNGWHHVWLSIEKHAVYRADPASISDERWAHLQKRGFTRRDSAAWWWRKVTSDFNGDEIGAAREFPITPEDCFAFAEGRWIMTWREAEVRHAGTWHDDGRTFRGWTYYPNSDGAESTVVGVDVGAGLGLDSSAIAVFGRRTGELKATYVSNAVSIPEFEMVVETAAKQWRAKAVRVESTGIGQGPYQHFRDETDLPVVEQKTNAGERHTRLTRLKVKVESGAMPIGKEVAIEAQASRIVKPKGPAGAPIYEGKDDLLNALSFGLKQLEEESEEAPPAPPKPDLREVFVPARAQKRLRTA